MSSCEADLHCPSPCTAFTDVKPAKAKGSAVTLLDYLRTLARNWPLIIALSLVGALVGLGLASQQTPMYRSTSSVILSAEPRETNQELVQGSTYASNLVDSYVRVATSELVLAPVIEELGLDRSLQSVANSVEASSPLDTLIIDISVVDPNPAEAQRIAAAVTEQLTAAAAVISPTSGDEPAVRLTTISSASLPGFPYAPNTLLLVALGLLAGTGAGVLIALARRLFGSTVSDASDVESVTELPVIGEIVESRGSPLTQTVLSAPLGREAESVRALVANMRFLAVGKKVRTLVVTSASPGESKSSVATAMAVVFAESSDRVLLVDADLRAPTVGLVANLNMDVGLSDVLVGNATLDEAVQDWAVDGLQVLVSGRIPPNPAQMLSSDAMSKLLDEAASVYDYVVIDSAPLLLVTDALWLAHHADSTLVVARRKRTTTRALGKAINALDKVSVSGVVLSRMPRGSKTEYGHVGPRTGRRAATNMPVEKLG